MSEVTLLLKSVVKLRFMVGYSHDEIAALLGVSEVTVRRQWKVAKAWLYQALKGQTGAAGTAGMGMGMGMPGDDD